MESALLVIVSIAIAITAIVYEVRREWKEGLAQEEAERLEKEQIKFKMDYTLELMMKEPKFKIVFEDSKGQIHETTPINPAIVSYRKMKIANSHTMASEILVAAFEKGVIASKDNVAFPTCNILSAKVAQHVEHVL